MIPAAWQAARAAAEAEAARQAQAARQAEIARIEKDNQDRERGKGIYYVPSAPSSPSFSPTPPPPPPTPPSPWVTTQSYTAPTGIKQADPDIVLAPATDTSGDYIVERFFEQLGGTELINLSRHDLIDGIKVEYNPIANLSELRKRFNPNNIIAIDYLSLNEFARPSIDLLSRGPQEPYFDEEGNLVVEIDIIRSQENIEVEISERGTVNRIEL
jgi:hypothetical protein